MRPLLATQLYPTFRKSAGQFPGISDGGRAVVWARRLNWPVGTRPALPRRLDCRRSNHESSAPPPIVRMLRAASTRKAAQPRHDPGSQLAKAGKVGAHVGLPCSAGLRSGLARDRTNHKRWRLAAHTSSAICSRLSSRYTGRPFRSGKVIAGSISNTR